MNRLAYGARVLIAGFLLLATGFWGLVITFSDAPAAWSVLKWTLYIVAWHVPSAFVLGLLWPAKWWLGLVASWGAGLMLLAYFAWGSAAALFGGAAGAAYAGRWCTKRIAQSRAARDRGI